MENYDYQQKLEKAWQHGVDRYRAGVRSADDMFDREQVEFLAGIGQTAQEFYDYAEDFVKYGEPVFGDVAAVADIRRAYFLDVQLGRYTGVQIDPATLPPKPQEVHGVPWLPRIIRKAHAKLRGELHPDIMYGCGGDRNFFRTHDIHPSDLLRATWEHEGDDEAIAQWVLAHSPAVKA